ncbi:MAG: transcription termination/antitermination NusG family protein [Ferruginibacter sp.]
MSHAIKSWYALFTKPGCEKKVANLLSRKNVENYCPLKRQVNGRKKVLLEPLFTSYVFVQIAETELVKIRATECVLNFVFWLGKPAVIRDEEIEIMKRFMNEYAIVKMEKIPFGVDGTLRVIGGLPEDNKAHMVSVKNNAVKIVLPSLGYLLIAEVDKTNVEILTSSNNYTIGNKYQFAI